MTPAMAIGTDIVQIARWEEHAEDGAFLRRAFTAHEISLYSGQPASLAGRWAVKESVLKALGVGIGAVPLTAIEVGRAEDGRPELTLHGRARELSQERGLTHWQVSLSHDGGYATAVVLAWG